VREFAELAFSHAGLDYRQYVVNDPDLFRPAEVNLLLGDCAKAQSKLGWKNQVGFEELVREMVEDVPGLKWQGNVGRLNSASTFLAKALKTLCSCRNKQLLEKQTTDFALFQLYGQLYIR